MSTLQGHLLIASPRLRDDNFFRSVVLMVHHQEKGAFGLILNRPSPRTLRQLWPAVGEGECPRDESIHVGGPVDGPLMALHGDRSISDEDAIVSGVYFTTLNRETLDALVYSDKPFRLFTGYSGWGEGQLENELQAGGWLSFPAHANDVFHVPASELWDQARSRVGDDFLLETLHVKHRPPDPEWN